MLRKAARRPSTISEDEDLGTSSEAIAQTSFPVVPPVNQYCKKRYLEEANSKAMPKEIDVMFHTAKGPPKKRIKKSNSLPGRSAAPSTRPVMASMSSPIPRKGGNNKKQKKEFQEGKKKGSVSAQPSPEPRSVSRERPMRAGSFKKLCDIAAGKAKGKS